MNLLIDQGNSFCKIALYKNNNLEKLFRFKELTRPDLEEIINQYQPKSCILTSVKKIDASLLIALKELDFFHQLSDETKFPILIKYQSPKTLGKDRLAAAVGAYSIFPEKNLLIIDFGTAITYDVVLASGKYIGGNIAPGIHARYKSLHTETDQLPLLRKAENFDIIGNSTEHAIINGVQNGIIFEIQGYINYMTNNHNDFKVIFTGGDASFFAKKIKTTIFVEPNLIFVGLNKILEYNE